ncbi:MULTISPECIES: nucleotidyltransferase domain-containing protein [unclassified Neorhizobium]|uniref:nucleotidyltransferase domain-containing protein n=1 Tax=unclassified Neorhizobium TaxID=2629175 RepID=UPI001FF119DB|nr:MULTISPECIES: nucleotidyltransferase domain-containing protein [unclassified Neorhizobium]MCJ9673278.1 nucleotidyltransferase domain-containing protein [Neorhizobium sp. SHOUNA12B]MCJ9748666.1 nucleotidyltransferase domain-containing protein [Neorhizobium sp. SHOUNA12A]
MTDEERREWIIDYLKGRGTSLDELPNAVRPFVAGEFLMLGGSVASCTANEGSDIDLFTFSDRPIDLAPSLTIIEGIDCEEVFYRSNGPLIAFEIYPCSMMNRAASKMTYMTDEFFMASTDDLTNYKQILLEDDICEVLHRVKTGLCIGGYNEVCDWKLRLKSDSLDQYLLYRNYTWFTLKLEDYWAQEGTGNTGTGLLMFRSVVRSLIFTYMNACGYTNCRDKWQVRMLDMSATQTQATATALRSLLLDTDTTSVFADVTKERLLQVAQAIRQMAHRVARFPRLEIEFGRPNSRWDRVIGRLGPRTA